jgi:hypothetical protein
MWLLAPRAGSTAARSAGCGACGYALTEREAAALDGPYRLQTREGRALGGRADLDLARSDAWLASEALDGDTVFVVGPDGEDIDEATWSPPEPDYRSREEDEDAYRRMREMEFGR